VARRRLSLTCGRVLMPSDGSTKAIAVRFTPEFKRNLRALSKKYRHTRSDVEPAIEQIEAGDFVGDQVPGTGHTIFKARVRNSDIRKGKSAGYRLIYYLETAADAVLVTVYSKSEQSDISSARIRRIVNEFESGD
jgi:mRNA-degrading endonuclease RelE of RelBE toxin-antitoxin system